MTNADETPLASERDAGLLYGAVFLNAFGAGCWLIALPFIVKHLHGSDAGVGLPFAAMMGTYAISLVVVGPFWRRFNPQRAVQIGTGGCFLSIVITGVVVLVSTGAASGAATLPNPIWLLTGAAVLFGIAASAFWPILMAWLAIGCHVSKLNRRLARFSVAWSLGMIISPVLGGCLTQVSYVWPIAVAGAMLLLSFVAVTYPRNPNQSRAPGRVSANDTQVEMEDLQEKASADQNPNYVVSFRWMARIALFASWLCMGLARTQVAVLFKFELYYTESLFGVFSMMVSLAAFVVYLVVGRTQVWHRRFWLFMFAQMLTVAAMPIILFSTSLFFLFFAAVLMGLGMAFCYSSHLFYSASSKKKHSAFMAVHEFTLSAGFVLGALGGGFLSDQFTRYTPYVFGAVVMTLALSCEVILWVYLRKRVMEKPPDVKPGGSG